MKYDSAFCRLCGSMDLVFGLQVSNAFILWLSSAGVSLNSSNSDSIRSLQCAGLLARNFLDQIAAVVQFLYVVFVAGVFS